MKFSEEQVKEIVALKESLIEQIDKHQEGDRDVRKKYHSFRLVLKRIEFYKSISIRNKKRESESKNNLKS